MAAIPTGQGFQQWVDFFPQCGKLKLADQLWPAIKTDSGESITPSMTRRSFLDWFLATSFGGFLIPIFYPVTRYLVLPKVEESTSWNVTLSIKLEEVKANSAQIFRFGSQPGILLRTSAGDLRAFSAVCTHLACIVQYRADLVHIWCACHNGHFDLNGKNIAGPPPRPLEQFSVNVRGDRLVVSKGV